MLLGRLRVSQALGVGEFMENLIQRPFAGLADLEKMKRVVLANPTIHFHVVDLPYRLCSWGLDNPQNIGIWENEQGEMRAWVILNSPFWAVDYVLHPAVDPAALELVLQWVNQQALTLVDQPTGRPAWFISVLKNNEAHRQRLETAGFASQAQAEDPWSKVFLKRDNNVAVPETSLPAGLAIRPLAGPGEVEAYVNLHRAAFGSNNMTAEWRARTLTRPEYVPELDLVMVNEEGQLVAFCICWFTAIGPEGEPTAHIEPLGVHPDWHGRGLGKLMLTEAIKRMYGYGAKQILVETDDFREAAVGLYHNLGFRVQHEILVYRKDFA